MIDSTNLSLENAKFLLLCRIVHEYRDHIWYYPGGWPFDDHANVVNCLVKKLEAEDSRKPRFSIPISKLDGQIIFESFHYIKGGYLYEPESSYDDFDWTEVDTLYRSIVCMCPSEWPKDEFESP